MAERLTLPVLPLREVVLFPGVTAPIGAGRPATLRAIEAALAGPERLVFAVSQRQNVESVSSDVLYTIGTIARIGQLQRGLSGMQLLLHGERRGIAIHYTDKEGYLQAVVREAEEMLPLIQEEPAERQREMFLREQMKTIQRELGEGDERDDLQELKDTLAALDLPPEARKEVDREFGRLSRIGRESMESQVIRTFLENIAELPWNERSKEHLELPEAQRILDEDHYALGDVKDRVLEFLAVRQLRLRQESAEREREQVADGP